MSDRVKPSFVIFDIRILSESLTLSHERQSARMSKITNDGLTRSGTGCLYSCTNMATVGVKGLRTCRDVVVVYSMSEECATSLSLCMSIYYIRIARSMTSVCLSACPQHVCYIPLLCQKGQSYGQNSFTASFQFCGTELRSEILTGSRSPGEGRSLTGGVSINTGRV